MSDLEVVKPSEALTYSEINAPEFLERLRTQTPDGQEAFTILVQATHDRLVGFILRNLESEDECRTRLQEIYVDVHKGLPGFTGKGNLTTWIYTLAYQKICECKLNPERLLARNAVEKLIGMAVGVLPGIARQAYLLRDVEGFTAEETAEILSTSVENVRIQVHGARRKIVDWVQEKMTKARVSN